MLGSQGLRASPCKRDALPTELTALRAETRHLCGFAGCVNRHGNGTERKQVAGRGTESPGIVPKRKPFPFEQASPDDFAQCRRLLRHAPDAKYTYFMRDRVSGLIKIGMALDPSERQARLSSSGARDMEIMLTLRDGNLEGCYHQHFADLCVGGEWFEPHDDILAEIERLQHQTQ